MQILKPSTMKRNYILGLIITVVFTFISCKPKQNEPLFNGKDLSNWTIFLKSQEANPDTVFQVVDGTIQVSGQPFGYLRSKEVYSNYKLHLEYRWLSTPANSGIFLHATGEDRIWPLCYECQLWNTHAGDIILMGTGMGMTVRDTAYVVVPGEKRSLVRPKFEASNEKPAGEWNIVDITCDKDNVEIILNGVLQNKGTGLSASSGNICLQSEGGPMQFRNIRLDQLGK
jgi:hypothetical protein